MKPFLPLLAATALCASVAQAQTRDITGRVVSADKSEPLPGVTVVVKGTTNGSGTDAEGQFKLQVRDKQDVTLVLSYLGYKAQEVVVKPDQTIVEVKLSSEAAALNDVVVIGYGTVRKRDLTGAVSSVKGEEVTRLPVTTVTEALQGKVPGADISRANGYAGHGVLDCQPQQLQQRALHRGWRAGGECL
jgi:hypothetical protein